MHIDNKNKDIVILDERSTQGLDNTTLIAEAEYFIDFSKLQRKFCLSLHYNGRDSFLFVNATKIYHFRAKNLIKTISIMFKRYLKDFTTNKGPYIKYVRAGLESFCGGHGTF